MQHIKIAITDDHPMVVNGIRNMLYYYKHIEICNTYNSGTALLEGLQKDQPDVLLLDIQIPDKSGNELARIISATYPHIRILAISSMENSFHVKDMMQHGCLGYIVKTAEANVLVEAIETVYAGEEYIDPALKEQLLSSLLKSKKQTDNANMLTRREKEILQLIAAAHTSQQIADELHISVRTVDNHRFSLLQKLNVKNTVALIKTALQMGLIN